MNFEIGAIFFFFFTVFPFFFFLHSMLRVVLNFNIFFSILYFSINLRDLKKKQRKKKFIYEKSFLYNKSKLLKLFFNFVDEEFFFFFFLFGFFFRLQIIRFRLRIFFF